MKIKNILSTAVALTVLSVAATSALATPWSFGVMADTQWSGSDPTGNNVNSVAVNQAKACNAAFVAAGVNFVVQVGDLTDNGSLAALQTRLDANTALNAASIPFYALRGNHEDSGVTSGVAGDTAFFQSHYMPTSSTGVNVEVAPDSLSYAVTCNNTKIVLLDIATAYSTTTLDSVTNWMSNSSTNGVLQESDHTQAFVFQHKNLLGQNHKDNEFQTGSNQDANPTQQNNFIAALANNNVKLDISGHDHVAYRSTVTSPDGASQVQQVICASDSYKYYTPATPTDSRDNPIAEQVGHTGYYIYTVDGPRVTAKYYQTTHLSNGDVPANPTWTLTDTFGYSLNGAQKLVASGSSYAMTNSIAAGTNNGETGFVGTTMAITSGTNSSKAQDYLTRTLTKDIETSWKAKNSNALVSDILTLTGMDQLGYNYTSSANHAADINNAGDILNSDKFTLQLTFDATGLDLGNIMLATLDSNGNWVNAISLDHGVNTGSYVGDAPAADATTTALGTYGIDTSAGLTHAKAWAVIDHNSDFAVVPEPSTYVLIGSGLVALLGFRRRSMK